MFEAFSKRKTGFEHESFARAELEKNQCKIIESNFSCKTGEIDIIAQDNEYLVFVEVRYRKKSRYGGALASVDSRKQKKLIRTAEFYLQTKNLTNKAVCRFDVFAIEGENNRLNYQWIKDAFGA